ncbi:unnamed protein product [Ambrosiozyma monospora]|uniref:Unnamed protein product n=1 Tax=Ambrosiozyma monospora TaxID=43982 RepID=A0A9W6Z033_AMBMO|nr:unnamed protein product [Ambrosiozyma monospora]
MIITLTVDQAIPRIEIQPDFVQVITDVQLRKVKDESFWINIANQTINIHVTQTGPTTTIFNCVESQQFKFTRLDSYIFQLVLKDHEALKSLLIRVPKQHLIIEHMNSDLTAISTTTTTISTTGEHEVTIVLGDSHGTIDKFTMPGLTTLGSTLKPNLSISPAHLLDITNLQIFPSPSSTVLLSTSLDFTTKIWSLLDGTNPRVFKGVQLERITSLVLIGHGRNFITGSTDGSAVLWECGSGEKLWVGRRVKNGKDAVLDLCVTDESVSKISKTKNNSDEIQDKFFECDDKTLYVAHQSGTISIWDLGTRCFLAEFNTLSSISSVTVSKTKIITGSSDGGLIKCFDRLTHKLLWETQLFNCIDESLSDDGIHKATGGEITKLRYAELNHHHSKDKVEVVIGLSSDSNCIFSLNVKNGELYEWFSGFSDGRPLDFDFEVTKIEEHDCDVYVCGKAGYLLQY